MRRSQRRKDKVDDDEEGHGVVRGVADPPKGQDCEAKHSLEIYCFAMQGALQEGNRKKWKKRKKGEEGED